MRQIFQWQARTSDNNGSKVSQCVRKNLFLLYSSVPYRYYKISIEEDRKKHIDIFNRQEIRDNGFLLLLSRLNSLSKVTRCFSTGFFATFFVRPKLTKESSSRQICRPPLLGLFLWKGYSFYPHVRMGVKYPIHIFVR